MIESTLICIGNFNHPHFTLLSLTADYVIRNFSPTTSISVLVNKLCHQKFQSNCKYLCQQTIWSETSVLLLYKHFCICQQNMPTQIQSYYKHLFLLADHVVRNFSSATSISLFDSRLCHQELQSYYKHLCPC